MAAMTLKQALENGNRAEVRKLLDQKVDVNEKDPRGWTPLHTAVNKGRNEEIKLLLKVGVNASINVRNDSDNTPLHIAASKDLINEDVLQLLLDAGADKSIGIKCIFGYTPLHMATWYWKNNNTFKCLLERPESKLVVNEVNNHGKTALHYAAWRGRIDFIKLLLKHGAKPSVNVKDKDGYTPLLHVITSQNKFEPEDLKAAMKILVDAGADVNVRDAKTGRTALHLAAVENDTDMVVFLSSIGADSNARDNKGFTPLSLALDSNKNQSHQSVIQMLKPKSFVTDADLNRLEDEVNRKRSVESTKLEELMSQLKKELSEGKQGIRLEVEKLEEKINQEIAVESTRLEEISRKFEEYSENAEARLSQLKKDLSEERQARRFEVEKLEDKLANQERAMESVKVEEVRKKFEDYSENTETRISQLMKMRKNDEGKIDGSHVILIILFLILYQFLVYFFTQ